MLMLLDINLYYIKTIHFIVNEYIDLNLYSLYNVYSSISCHTLYIFEYQKVNSWRIRLIRLKVADREN